MNDDDELAATEEDIDVRSVAIIWSGDDEPRLILNGCSEYEAFGLLMGAVRAVRRVATVELEDIDD